MIEVEIKVEVKNREKLEQRLFELGFTKGELIREEDIYFDTIEDFIRKNDHALRLRSSENMLSVENHHFITYKGPKLDQISMTRQELETKIGDSKVMKELLCALGYVKMYPVIKTRQYFSFGEMTACIDAVNDLGEFLELEMVVSEEERTCALAHIVEFLEKIGYDKEEIIRTSYLSMLQKK